DIAVPTVLCTRESATSVQATESANTLRLVVMDEPAEQTPVVTPEPILAGLSGSSEDVVIIQYTSGSTRTPKGVAVTNGNLLHNAALVADRWRLGPETVFVTWLPHYHDMGLMGFFYPTLFGGQVIQMSPFAFVQHPVRWLKAISNYGCTVTGGPAFAFAL